MPLDPSLIRQQFPSLQRADVFFDNPGGTQIARHSLERMQRYLLECNANHEGAFRTSRESDVVLEAARQAMADFVNAASPDEIVFGNNMTTITFNFARALSRRLSAGDEIVVTRLDHDANISPWLLTAEDRGCKVTWVDFDALGTINPVRKLTQMARQAGAIVYIDAVQYAPHGPIDVQQLDCDFLVCSSYKFFGPHAAALYGRLDLLEELQPYKVRPATNKAPNKFETGTQNHEGIAGILGAIEYFEWLGSQAADSGDWRQSGLSGRKLALKQAMTAIRANEFELSRALIEAIESVPGTRIYGMTDVRRLEERVPTVSFTMEGIAPRRLAERLAEEGFYTWDGNYYALAVTERLGVEESGGMLRVGAVHYNTLAEVQRLREALHRIFRETR
jgi:selenocysteine lyase/cysteine desulfurase